KGLRVWRAEPLDCDGDSSSRPKRPRGSKRCRRVEAGPRAVASTWGRGLKRLEPTKLPLDTAGMAKKPPETQSPAPSRRKLSDAMPRSEPAKGDETTLRNRR